MLFWNFFYFPLCPNPGFPLHCLSASGLCHEFFLNHFRQIEFFAFPESKHSFAPFQHFLHLSVFCLVFVFFFLESNLSCSFVGRDCLIWFYFISHRTCMWAGRGSVHSTVLDVLKSYNEIFTGHSVDILKNLICSFSVYPVP